MPRPRIGTIPRARLRDARWVRDALKGALSHEGLGGVPAVTLVGGSFGVQVKYPFGVGLREDCIVVTGSGPVPVRYVNQTPTSARR